MSIITNVSNYGGRVQDNQQGIKQFYSTPFFTVSWILKKIGALTVITPANNKYPVLIDNNLIVNGSILNPSDENLKTNIRVINKETLINLDKLTPVEFYYKNTNINNLHYGLIAQDVEKLIPDLVNNDYGYKQLNYVELIPLLLAKIQFLEQEINNIKNANNTDNANNTNSNS